VNYARNGNNCVTICLQGLSNFIILRGLLFEILFYHRFCQEFLMASPFRYVFDDNLYFGLVITGFQTSNYFLAKHVLSITAVKVNPDMVVRVFYKSDIIQTTKNGNNFID
jgi:hypothetical protein